MKEKRNIKTTSFSFYFGGTLSTGKGIINTPFLRWPERVTGCIKGIKLKIIQNLSELLCNQTLNFSNLLFPVMLIIKYKSKAIISAFQRKALYVILMSCEVTCYFKFIFRTNFQTKFTLTFHQTCAIFCLTSKGQDFIAYWLNLMSFLKQTQTEINKC